ncbi:MAG: thioredoxin family protein [Fuerstiella sp.]|nr:thioredoxin family protein [Fuerstiella sp.]
MNNVQMELTNPTRFQMFMLAAVIPLSGAAGHAAAPDIGDKAPAWRFLQGTDGLLHSRKDLDSSEILVVAFLCNKCPCVKGYEARFKRLQIEFGPQGLTFVGINSAIGPLENMNEMRRRAADARYNFHYLFDTSQQVGRGYGATSTPHVFVLDQNRRIAYSGAFDDNRNESLVKHHFVVNAVSDLLARRPVAVTKTKQFGCAINYR